MILYIADTGKIEKYYLPNSNTNSNLLFKYTASDTQNEYFFNVFKKDNEWYIKNDENFSVKNDKLEFFPTLLKEYNAYPLKISGCNARPVLFCCNSTTEQKQNFQIPEDMTGIFIGNETECQIYNSNLFSFKTPVKIYLENQKWYILSNQEEINCYLYLNNKIITTKRQLKRGDIIFVNGLKIIWMENFLKISDVNGINVRR